METTAGVVELVTREHYLAEAKSKGFESQFKYSRVCGTIFFNRSRVSRESAASMSAKNTTTIDENKYIYNNNTAVRKTAHAMRKINVTA